MTGPLKKDRFFCDFPNWFWKCSDPDGLVLYVGLKSRSKIPLQSHSHNNGPKLKNNNNISNTFSFVKNFHHEAVGEEKVDF